MSDRNAVARRLPASRAAARRLTGVLGLLVAVLCAVPGVTTSVAQAAALTGWLGSGAQFPNRALVLVPPAGAKVSTSTVHVTENGASVSGLSVTPTAHAGPRDFGLMVVADRSSSMKGAGLKAVTSAASSLVGLRQAAQQFGLIGFDRHASVLAPLSGDSAGLPNSVTPSPGNVADIPGAVQLALSKLGEAHVALGAIVIVSDGVGQLAGGSVTPAAASDAAAAAHTPIFVVGLQDKLATASSLATLRRAVSGQFVQAPPGRLPSVMAAIDQAVTHGYVARWRSAVRAGQAANVSASVTGAPGTVTGRYQAPRSTAEAVGPNRVRSHPALSTHAAQLATTGHLSATPTFIPAAATATVPAPTPAPATPSTFWATGAGQAAIALFVGLLVAAAVWLTLYRPSRRAVRVRVGSFVHMGAEVADDPMAGPAVSGKSIVHRLENSERWKTFALDVEIARSPHTPIYLVKRAIVLAMVLAGLFIALSGSSVLGFVPLIGWWFVLKSMMRRAANKQREKFRQTLPGYLQDLASAIRVGRSLVAALTVVAESAEEPTKSELERAVTDEALGRPLDASLEAVGARMEATDLDQVAIIAALNRRSGSNVAEALDRVAEGARERQDLKREVKALTAQAKMSSWVLTALPGVLLLGLALISPMYAHPLFHTTMGIIAMCVGAGMVFAGWKVLSKITDVRV